MSVAKYRALVASRYGDKLAGSAYDKSGQAGGFDTGAPASTPVAPWAPVVALAFGVVLVVGVRTLSRR